MRLSTPDQYSYNAPLGVTGSGDYGIFLGSIRAMTEADVQVKRQLYKRLVIAMLAILLAVFAWISFQVVFAPRGYRVPVEQWRDIAPGSAEMIRRDADYVWIVRFDLADRREFESLPNAANALDTPGVCDPSVHVACEFAGEVAQGVVIRYIEEKPVILANHAPWFGGFTNPATGAFYDRFGRAYQTDGEAVPAMKLLRPIPKPAS